MSRRLWLAAALLCAAPAAADLPADDLAAMRVITVRDWLHLRLQVLGQALSYPAYRVNLALAEDNRIRFEFWISTPMSRHLTEAGRRETERILAYHAEGMQNRVADLLEREFATLWPAYDSTTDFSGEFLTPGDELESPPDRWASWREGDLEWSWRP